VHKMNLVDDRVESVDAALAKYKVGDAVQAVVTEVSPPSRSCPFPAGLRQARAAGEMTVHPRRVEAGTCPGDMLKDKIKG